MKIACLALFLFLWSPNPSVALDWSQEKGEHFIVYFIQNPRLAKEVLDTAEVYYRRIADDLGYPRHSDFWTWEKRVKIYIHPDQKTYIKATGEPEWSAGIADYTNKQISSYAGSKNFLASILPHEIAHLTFRDFIGFNENIPLWIDEGVAQWEEGEASQKELLKKAKELYEKDSLLSMSDITLINIRSVDKLGMRLFFRPTRTKENKMGIIVLSPDVLVNTYYIEAGSLIGFLIEKYGANSFVDFCRRLRDGQKAEDALLACYPEHIRSLDDLEDEWRKYLNKP